MTEDNFIEKYKKTIEDNISKGVHPFTNVDIEKLRDIMSNEFAKKIIETPPFFDIPENN